MNTRVRDIIEKKQNPHPQIDERAEKLAANAKKHITPKSDPSSWQNPQKYEPHLVNMFDATPTELIDVAELLETAYFSQEDRDSGVAAQIALAAVRGE